MTPFFTGISRGVGGAGFGNARHSGGGCGDSPSASQYSNETFEVWFSE